MNEPIFKYKTKIYISKKLPSTQDEDMNEIEHYEKPQKYIWNVQPANSTSEIREFGEIANAMKVAVVPKRKYNNKFKAFDRAYIDIMPSDNELDYGDNADYRIYGIRPQNACIRIYFIKLVNEEIGG